jgi:membrane protease YdiL (CAAX protease family)
MISTLNNIFEYLKNPEFLPLEGVSIKNKLAIVLKTLGISLITGIVLALFIGVIAETGLIDMKNHSLKDLEKYPPLVLFIIVAVAAPIIEECIFRAPLILFKKNKNTFKYVYYGFAILFGYVHIYNYGITTNVLLLSPILIAPQIILGLYLGYLRVKLGLLYSVLLHGLYNGILTLPLLLTSGS